jgi:hypothetical protein
VPGDSEDEHVVSFTSVVRREGPLYLADAPLRVSRAVRRIAKVIERLTAEEERRSDRAAKRGR